MSAKLDHLAIAKSLTNGQPLAYAIKDDGSLVVVAHTGQKFRFTADQVANEAEKLKPKPAPTKSPKQTDAEEPKAAPPSKKPAPKPAPKKSAK